MLASCLRRFGAGALFGACVIAALSGGACGGQAFTLVAGDGGAVADGGDDSSVADASSDGQDQGFCASQMPKHFLCDDFDGRARLDVKGIGLWDTFETSSYSNGVLDKNDAVSQPRSFLVDTTHAGIMGTETKVLVTKGVGHVTALDVAFDFKLDAYGGDGGSFDKNGVILTFVTYGTLTYQLVLLSPTEMAFQEVESIDGGSPQNVTQAFGVDVPVGSWTHIELGILPPVLGQMNPAASVKINGQTAYAGKLTLVAPLIGANATVALGMLLGFAPNLWQLRYDNVTIDRVT